jgi:hypothetical protein
MTRMTRIFLGTRMTRIFFGNADDADDADFFGNADDADDADFKKIACGNFVIN